MRTHCGPRIDATILGAASLLALVMGSGNAEGPDRAAASAPPSVVATEPVATEPVATELVGVWTSADREVRLELRADGRYDRSIVGRDAVSSGAYRVDGTTVLLRDDSGLRTTVTVLDHFLEMAGHRLHRD
jgi:hypothetical protein